jgi:hypothetical protein
MKSQEELAVTPRHEKPRRVRRKARGGFGTGEENTWRQEQPGVKHGGNLAWMGHNIESSRSLGVRRKEKYQRCMHAMHVEY